MLRAPEARIMARSMMLTAPGASDCTWASRVADSTTGRSPRWSASLGASARVAGAADGGQQQGAQARAGVDGLRRMDRHGGAVAAFEPRFSLFCTGLNRLWWYSRADTAYPDQFVAMQTRILIIEDHVLVREAMALTLAQVGEGLSASRPATPPRRSRCWRPTRTALTSWWSTLMLPEINGFSLLGVIAKRFPRRAGAGGLGLDDRSPCSGR